jgi:hypothetical protein
MVTRARLYAWEGGSLNRDARNVSHHIRRRGAGGCSGGSAEAAEYSDEKVANRDITKVWHGARQKMVLDDGRL